MKFKTKNASYDVDLKTRHAIVVSGEVGHVFDFEAVSRLYVGSTGAKFYHSNGSLLHATTEITEMDTDDLAVTGAIECGNVVFRTQNSTYEVNQEEKLLRRLGGNNPGFDGEFRSYQRVTGLKVGERAVFDNGPQGYFRTSTIREVHGIVVTAPEAV